MIIVSLKTLYQDHMDAYCVIKGNSSGSFGFSLCHKGIASLCPLHAYGALCQDHLDAYCVA